MIELKRRDQVGVWLAVIMCALVVVMFLGVGLALNAEGNSTGLVLMAFALPMIWLTLYVYREAAARSFARIRFDQETLHLRLPARRSFVHDAKRDTSLPLSSIAAIEHRLESFRGSAGLVLQHAYSILLKDGGRILLGADRAMLAPFYAEAADAIAAKAGLTIRELGVVEANAGFLLLGGQSAPPWDSAPLPAPEAERRMRNAGIAWRVLGLLITAVLLITAYARMLGGG